METTSTDREFGLQFTIHHADGYTIPDIVEFAEVAEANGFSRLWLNDNLRYRNLVVALTAVASETSIDLGTAILVPYFRNPVDVADALASISELTGEGEISVGIGRGSRAADQLRPENPLATLRETPEFLRTLLDGGTVRFGDYETLTSFFNLEPDHRLELDFPAQSSFRFYYGGYGPKGSAIAGEHMDGVVFGGSAIPMLQTGKIDELVGIARDAAGDRAGQFRTVAEINVSVTRDGEAAREFAKRYVAQAVPNLEKRAGADYEAFGIDPANVRDLADALEDRPAREVTHLVTDAMVDATYIAGDPETCRSRLAELYAETSLDRFDRIVFAKLGPDYERTVELLASEVLPEVFD